MSEQLRRRFIKDQQLPIQMVSDEEFTYFMNLYDPLFGCWEKYKQFMYVVKSCGGEVGYFKMISEFTSAMISAITSTHSFAVLNAKGKVVDYTPIHTQEKVGIYHPNFCKKEMISIDIKSANFNALRSFDSDAVLGCSTYEELAKKFTEYEYVASNKQIRQVIFGKTCPEKLQKIQKSTLDMILDNILLEYPEFKISVVGSDELIVYEYGGYSIAEAYALVTACIPRYVDYIRSEIFSIEQVHSEKHYFARRIWDAAIVTDPETESVRVEHYGFKLPVFKSVPSLYFAQVFKSYFGLEITKEDLVFIHEGLVARFDKGIF